MAELRATPMSNPIMGLLADRLKKAQQFGAKPFGYENPPVEMLMNLLGVPAVQQTMERMAYGEPLTIGSGMTTKPRAEAVEAAMTLLPASAGLAKATKGLPVGASIKSIDDIISKYPEVIIDASVGKKDINLSRIVVPKEMRNQGVGTQVMSDLSEYADSIGKRITLTPSGDFGGSVPKLKTFYKELGFVENKGKNKDFSTRETMYREPQPVDTSPSYPQDEQPIQGLLQPRIPSPSSLTMPDVPTVEQMQNYGRTEVVPLSKVVSFQSARQWDKFNKGEHAGDLVQGFGDKPLALRLENGEYVIYDGNHRTDLALQAGKTELPMNVIDVKSYDPAHAGRRPVPDRIDPDELLRSLLE